MRADAALVFRSVFKEPRRWLETAPPLETGAVLDEYTVEESSHRLWCRSVMAVREKCDEKSVARDSVEGESRPEGSMEGLK